MANPLQNKIVYIGVPKRLFDSDLLDTAYQYIFTQTQDIVDPRGMFASNEQWLKAFPDYLMTCDAMVIVTDNGYVGRGVYLEWQHFKDTKRPIFLFNERATKVYQLREVKSLTISDEGDWTYYAIVHY